MKQKNLLLTIILFISIIQLTSCSLMYQVLEVNSTDVKLEKDSFIYENSDVKILYNFWTEGGQVSFLIYNKSDEPIFIDWNRSHLIYSGISYEYWYDLEETRAFYNSASQYFSTAFADLVISKTDESSSKFKPKKNIQIPPKSAIVFSKYAILKDPYYTCEFPFRFKTSKSFSLNNSPVSFRNYLTYSFKESLEQSKIVDNEFFIATIRDMDMFEFGGKSATISTCNKYGVKSSQLKYPYPYKKPNAFYIKAQQ